MNFIKAMFLSAFIVSIVFGVPLYFLNKNYVPFTDSERYIYIPENCIVVNSYYGDYQDYIHITVRDTVKNEVFMIDKDVSRVTCTGRSMIIKNSK